MENINSSRYENEIKILGEESKYIYLENKKMYKLTNWFDNKYKNTAVEDLSYDFIDNAELITLSKDPEFQQILFEASLKIVNNIDILELLIKQNEKLIRVIENELNTPKL